MVLHDVVLLQIADQTTIADEISDAMTIVDVDLPVTNVVHTALEAAPRLLATHDAVIADRKAYRLFYSYKKRG